MVHAGKGGGGSKPSPEGAAASPLPSPFQCAPRLRRTAGQSCVTPVQMRRLVGAYGSTHGGTAARGKIGGSGGSGSSGSSGSGRRAHVASLRELRALLRTHYHCETEYCMVRSAPGLSGEERAAMLRRFRPAQPAAWAAKPTEWLDSYNIEDVMLQYEEAFPDFDFVGPVPIDFDAPVPAAAPAAGTWGRCVVDELCALDLRKAAAAGTRRIGIIFNLDPHDQPGSHWVCAFIDLRAAAAYYYDSYGMPPPPEVERLLRRLQEQGVRTLVWNDLRAQYGNAECGVYCLMVIICLLRGRSFEQVCAMRVTDAMMNAFRDILFATDRPRGKALNNALPVLCA